MTKNLKKYFLLLLAFALASGCGKKENKEAEVKQNQNAVNVEAYNNLEKVNIGGNVTLKYQFKKGDKFSYRLTTITMSDQTIHADSVIKSKSNQTTYYTFDFNVKNVDKNNVAEIQATISSMKIDADMNGQKVVYDSKANNSPQTKAQFVEYESITNSPFIVKIDPKGNVVDVTGMDKVVDKFLAAQPPKQKLTADQKSNLVRSIAQVLQPITQMIFKEVPDKPVAKDSSWVRQYPGSLAIFQMTNTAKYTVQDFVKVNGLNAAKINASLNVKWSGNKQGSENGMNYTFSDPKITGGGIILFGVDNGKVIKSETSTNVEMNVVIESKDSSQKTKKTTRKDVTSNRNIVELI